MEILNFKKMSNSKYKVITNEGEILLYEDVIIKFNLLTNKNIDLNMLNKLLKENEYYEIYNLSIKYIEIKMRSKKELKNYLNKKDFDYNVINNVITKLEELNLLNDENYIKAFINDKINLSNIGPLKIKEDLLKMNLNEDEIDKYLNSFDRELWISKIKKQVEKKIKLNKNKSLIMFKKNIYNSLLFQGYSNDMIEDGISDISFDDSKIVEKEYNKVYKKLSKKYEGDTLKYMVKKELFKKGLYLKNEE